MLDAIRKLINKYERFLLFVLADIVISVETIWFIELTHLVTSESPSSLLWQGGLGYLLSLLVSYYFVKNLIFSVEERYISRFIKFWSINTIVMVFWQFLFETAYYFRIPSTISYVFSYLLGKVIVYRFYKERVFVNDYGFGYKWIAIFIVGILLVPTALQQTFTSAYHLLKSADHSANVKPTKYLVKTKSSTDYYDPEWGDEYIIYLKDEWFNEDPSVFNKDLAYTCGILSDVSYFKQVKAEYDGDEAIEELYGALGFDWINTTSYSFRSKTVDKYVNILTGESNGAAYVVAGKRLDNGEKLIMVSICGSVTLDFIDDLEMGLNRNYEIEGHAGFYNAADEIISGFMKNKNFINDKTTVIFTGHSRGGGVSNVAAAMMIERYDEIGIHPTVMAYTFASPNTSGCLKVKEKNYDTIFNIINPLDLITYIPFETMGLTRYGTDIVLFDLDDMDVVTEAIEEVKRIFDNDINVDYTNHGEFMDAVENMEALYTPQFMGLGLPSKVIKTVNLIQNMNPGNYFDSHRLRYYVVLTNKGLD